jgi:hypothetical protein
MLDESKASPTMGKNPADSKVEILQASGKMVFARPGGSDGEKGVWKDRARCGNVGLDGSGRRTTSPTRDAHAPTTKRNDDPNTCSERHGTNPRAR